MFLTPKDIHDKTFKRSFKGYDENEVDEFLDLIIKEFNIMIDENERLRQELNAKPAGEHGNNATADEIRRLESMLEGLIISVQKNKRDKSAEAPPQDAAGEEERQAERLQKAKLEEFKKALDESKNNFEKLIEEQRKSLDEKYQIILGELNELTGAPGADDAPDAAKPAENDEKAASLRPASQPAESAASGLREKPPFLINSPETLASTTDAPATEGLHKSEPETAAERTAELGEEPSARPRRPGPSEEPVSRREKAGTAETPQYGSGFSIRRSDEPQHGSAQQDSRFKPNYAEYEWLYKEKGMVDSNYNPDQMDINFKNPREKDELKRLIEEVID